MVNFVQRLRGEIKFSGIDELIEQIGRDIAKAREILAPHFNA
jgi:riboflavin kinase/FMN adenylyltransferase